MNRYDGNELSGDPQRIDPQRIDLHRIDLHRPTAVTRHEEGSDEGQPFAVAA